MNPLQTQELMMQVVRQMKEIPELPSESPTDVQPLLRVDFPEYGGVLTYMGGQPYPYKGFPFFEFVDKIDIVKKISRAVLSGLYHQLKHRKVLLVTLLPALWMIRPAVRVYLYVVYRLIARFKLKSNKYCDAVREVYRAFSPQENNEFHLMVRDTLCMILEMDNAYRFRFQDIIVNLDKGALAKNPCKELFRLLKVLSEREKTQDLRDTWVLFRLAIRVYLFADRQFKKILVDGLGELDLEKVQLSIEDKLYAAGRKDYVCGFLLHPDQDGTYCIEINRLREEWNETRKKIQNESTEEHHKLFAQHTEEQRTSVQAVPLKRQEQIKIEITEKVKKLHEKMDKTVTELAEKCQKEEKELVISYLTKEQRETAQKQNEEVLAMNDYFEKKLKDAEEAYKTACEQFRQMLE